MNVVYSMHSSVGKICFDFWLRSCLKELLCLMAEKLTLLSETGPLGKNTSTGKLGALPPIIFLNHRL